MLLGLKGRWLRGDLFEMWLQGLPLLLPGDTYSSCHQPEPSCLPPWHQRQLRACGPRCPGPISNTTSPSHSFGDLACREPVPAPGSLEASVRGRAFPVLTVARESLAALGPCRLPPSGLASSPPLFLVLSRPLTCCVTLGRVLPLSGLGLYHLQNENSDPCFLLASHGRLGGSSEILVCFANCEALPTCEDGGSPRGLFPFAGCPCPAVACARQGE